jgi:hypothetical protein
LTITHPFIVHRHTGPRVEKVYSIEKICKDDDGTPLFSLPALFTRKQKVIDIRGPLDLARGRPAVLPNTCVYTSQFIAKKKKIDVTVSMFFEGETNRISSTS